MASGKKIAKRDTRRILIYLTGFVLTVLVGTVLVLIIGRGVPLLHFVVMTEHDFRCDETEVTPLPTGGSARNNMSSESCLNNAERRMFSR